jgi:hypothetical protein
MKSVLLIKKSSFCILQKGGALPLGSIRTWGGVEYVKAAPGDWRRRVAGKEKWDSSSTKVSELKMADFGTPDEVREMAKMPLSVDSFAEAREILTNIVDKSLTSRSGLTATLSKKSIKEILSGVAIGKSVDLKAHLKAAANLDRLYANAIERWKFELNTSKNNEGLKDRRYLYAPMEYNNRILPIKMTVKEYKDAARGKRLYSIEAINVVINE